MNKINLKSMSSICNQYVTFDVGLQFGVLLQADFILLELLADWKRADTTSNELL